MSCSVPKLAPPLKLPVSGWITLVSIVCTTSTIVSSVPCSSGISWPSKATENCCRVASWSSTCCGPMRRKSIRSWASPALASTLTVDTSLMSAQVSVSSAPPRSKALAPRSMARTAADARSTTSSCKASPVMLTSSSEASGPARSEKRILPSPGLLRFTVICTSLSTLNSSTPRSTSRNPNWPLAPAAPSSVRSRTTSSLPALLSTKNPWASRPKVTSNTSSAPISINPEKLTVPPRNWKSPTKSALPFRRLITWTSNTG